jgi:hypothetical protein
MAPGACARVRQGFHRLKYMFVIVNLLQLTLLACYAILGPAIRLLRLKPAAAGVLGWKQNIVCFLSKAQFIISSKKKKTIG